MTTNFNINWTAVNLQATSALVQFAHKHRIRDERYIRYDVVGSTQVSLVVEYIDETQCKHAPHVNCQRYQELKEEAIISPSDTVINPRAVVIKRLQNNSKRQLITDYKKNTEFTKPAKYIAPFFVDSILRMLAEQTLWHYLTDNKWDRTLVDVPVQIRQRVGSS